MKEDTIKTIGAMACVTVLCVAGLLTGHNGILLGTGLGILSGLGGYFAGKKAD